MEEGLRQEWLDAVAASRWNLWLVPMFFTLPLMVLVPIIRRWHWAITIVCIVIGMVLTWFSLWFYSETIWETICGNAETDAEIEECVSDTGRVFGPFLLGGPFAVFYAGICVGAGFLIKALLKSIGGGENRLQYKAEVIDETDFSQQEKTSE